MPIIHEISSIIPIGPIDRLNPINISAPLSRGLTAFIDPATRTNYRKNLAVYTGSVPTTTNAGRICFDFSADSSSNYIDLGNVITSKIFTIAVWVKHLGNFDHQNIIVQRQDNDDSSVLAKMNTANVWWGPNWNTKGLTAAADADALEWNFLVLTCLGNGNTAQIYVNAKPSGTTGTGSISTFAGTRIGNNNPSSGSSPLNGYVGDVLIWSNRALTAQEVVSLQIETLNKYPNILNRAPLVVPSFYSTAVASTNGNFFPYF